MLIKVNPDILEDFARAWLKSTLQILEKNLTLPPVHPDDIKDLEEDMKAVKHLLEYLGEYQ